MIDYYSIPDGASDETISFYIKCFLEEKEEILARKGALFTFEQLEYIADIEPMGEYRSEDLDALSRFIADNLDYDNPELIDLVLTIVIQMHLTQIWSEIIHKEPIENEEVRRIIKDSIDENAMYSYFK